MLISVLLPARNAASTISLAVSSTLRELPADAEVLVLDDGSTDNTAALVATFSDPRLRLLRVGESSGLANGLNLLLREAQGSFVARMDADDVVLPGRFRTQVRQLKNGMDMTFGGVIHFGEKLRVPYPSPPLPISPEAFSTALLIANPVAHSTMSTHRVMLSELGGYRNCAAEDYDLWLRAATRGMRMNRTARPVTALRRHHHQVTATPGWSDRALRDPLLRSAFTELRNSTLGTKGAEQSPGALGGDPFDDATQSVPSAQLRQAIRRQSPIDRAALWTLLRRVERQR